VVTAYYVGDASEEGILATCQEWLARYKHPRKMFRVDTLFYTSSGKISRKLVRDAVSEGRLPS
jgi:acyl-CoA synthetase (AMP-forming)/AMP-acid ligase II